MLQNIAQFFTRLNASIINNLPELLASHIDPVLAYCTSKLIMLVTFCQILGFVVCYLNIKGIFPTKYCALIRCVIIIALAILTSIFYARLFFWGFSDGAFDLMLLIIAFLLSGQARGFNAWLVPLSLITASISVFSVWALGVPILNATGLIHLGVSFLGLFYLLRFNEIKEGLISWISGWVLFFGAFEVLKDFTILPSRNNKEQRQRLFELCSISATTLFFTIPAWFHSVFCIIGTVCFIQSLWIVLLVLSESTDEIRLAFAPYQVILTTYKWCRSIWVNYNPKDNLTYKNAFWSLIGFLSVGFLIYAEGYLAFILEHKNVESNSMSNDDKVFVLQGREGKGTFSSFMRQIANELLLQVRNYLAGFILVYETAKAGKSVVETLGDARVVRSSGESVTEDWANNSTDALREIREKYGLNLSPKQPWQEPSSVDADGNQGSVS